MSSNNVFPENSPLRQVITASVALLGGGRALLMQLAHPLVAAGVASHSHFQQNPLERLQHTVDLILGIVVGDPDQTRIALEQFNNRHIAVRGVLDEAAGPFAEGTQYTGHDPALKLWIFASLIDSILIAYEQFLTPLSSEYRSRFYDESRLLAQQFGIPDRLIPSDLDAFQRYMYEMLNNGVLIVTPAARELAKTTVKTPNVWIVARLFGFWVRFTTAGLLPVSLREGYEFSWGPYKQVAFQMLAQMTRVIMPHMPIWFRSIPAACKNRLLMILLTGQLKPSSAFGDQREHEPFSQVRVGNEGNALQTD